MAQTYNLSILQGDSFSRTLTIKDSAGTAINLSGYNAAGVARYKYSSTGVLLDLAPLIHPSLVSGLMTISGSSVGTENLPIGTFVYDVQIKDGGAYGLTILRGKFEVSPEVTTI